MRKGSSGGRSGRISHSELSHESKYVKVIHTRVHGLQSYTQTCHQGLHLWVCWPCKELTICRGPVTRAPEADAGAEVTSSKIVRANISLSACFGSHGGHSANIHMQHETFMKHRSSGVFLSPFLFLSSADLRSLIGTQLGQLYCILFGI